MNPKVVTWTLALSAVFLYIFVHRLWVGQPQRRGHAAQEFLVIVLPGIEWLIVREFVIGFVNRFLNGALLGLVYLPVYNMLARRFGVRG